jgi:hypothetical protein
MAKYNPARRGLDEQELEGGGSGAGSRSTSGTKWSNRPSFTSNASLMDDIRKIGKDTSHLKGNAKKVSEDAQDRAVVRTGVRAAGAGAVAAGAKMAASDASASDDDKKQPDSSGPAGIGEIISGKGMAKGGTASSRADGCAQRGKTKGTMVMCGGGMAKGKR